jgi:hypothetical protein
MDPSQNSIRIRSPWKGLRILMFLCESAYVFFPPADHLPHCSFGQMHFDWRKQPLRSGAALRSLLIWQRMRLTVFSRQHDSQIACRRIGAIDCAMAVSVGTVTAVSRVQDVLGIIIHENQFALKNVVQFTVSRMLMQSAAGAGLQSNLGHGSRQHAAIKEQREDCVSRTSAEAWNFCNSHGFLFCDHFCIVLSFWCALLVDAARKRSETAGMPSLVCKPAARRFTGILHTLS